MEAFAVAPAPPQSSPNKSSSGSGRSSGESSFAPILAKAVGDDTSLETGNSSGITETIDHGADKNAAAGDQEKTIPFPAEEEVSEFQESVKTDESILPFGLSLSRQADSKAAGKPAAAGTKAAFAVHFPSQPAAHVHGDQVEPSPEIAAAGKNLIPAQAASRIIATPAYQRSAGISTLSAAVPAEAGSRGTGENPLSSTGDSAPPAKPAVSADDHPLFHPRKSAGAASLLQNNDSISWSRGNGRMPHSLLQHQPLLPSAEIPSGHAVTALSAEKMFAGLTEIPARVKGDFSLRDHGLSLRREINSPPLFESYIQKADTGDTRSNGQQFPDFAREAQVQTSSSPVMKSGEGGQESSFSQSLSHISADKGQSPGEIMRPGALPFTQAAHENAILQQINQKFRISSNLQDSKLVLKLHPAELGSLKIDIQLKNGTISASILAQSRNVLDILEKNLPRLRAMMEDQGLSVEEIAINLDPDLPAEYNLFEDQLARDETSFSSPERSGSGLSFELEPEVGDDETAGTVSPTGVNVKA